MRQNALEFKNDIKNWVAAYKEGKDDHWMHPIYCAYYLVKHQILDPDKRKEFIENDIKRSYKALNNEWLKSAFIRIVNEYLGKYPETTVCTDQ